MPRSKEISDDVRRKIVEAHEAGKGYKTISKMLNVHRSTAISIIYKWKMFKTTATRPRSGRPTKMDILLRGVRRSGAGPQSRKVITEDERVQEKSERIPGTNTEDERVQEKSERIPGTNTEDERVQEKSERIPGTNTEDERVQEEEKSERILGRPDVTVHTRAENHEISLSTNPHGNPLPPHDPAVTKTMPKRTRGHKAKRKESGLMGPAEHPEEMILCCEICGACFPTEPDLESHQAQHLDKTLHECRECGKSFQSAAGLKRHKTRKHGC